MLKLNNLDNPQDVSNRSPDIGVIRPLSEVIKAFPTTRYYGSKREQLPWIYSCISAITFETVLDAFGGTASVSMLFQAMRKSVTYHDGLKFNEDVGRTLLAPELALSAKQLADFLNEVEPVEGFISKHFKGMYYTSLENVWLDGFMVRLANSSLAPDARSNLKYLLYQACLKKRPFNLFHRANLNLRTNTKVERSFGNYVTWERPFEELIYQMHGELSVQIRQHAKPAVILPASNVSTLEGPYDLVYIDPPYLSNAAKYNRDDYWRRYHFLEGLADYGRWSTFLDISSGIGVNSGPDWMDDWRHKFTFRDRLFELIEKHRSSIVVLSYVTDAFPSEEEIKALFERHFSQVSIHTYEYSHALSKVKKRELLFVGRPKNGHRKR
jgi:adenine-specific DNA-methyltransferase